MEGEYQGRAVCARGLREDEVMDIYQRRRVWAIGLGTVLIISLIVLYAWNSFVLSITSVDPAGNKLPTAQQTITVRYNHKLVDAKVTSVSQGITFTSSVKDDSFIIKLDRLLGVGTKVDLTISATSEQGSLQSTLSFTAAYVPIENMSEAQQALLANDSAGFDKGYPLAGNIPHVDISGPYSIDYGDGAPGATALPLVISDSTPHGRIAAIEWIRSQGVDPTTIDIRYDEYINPLTSGVSQ